MKPIDVAGFERKFRENIDPWNYASSPFERFKRRVLIRTRFGQTRTRARIRMCQRRNDACIDAHISPTVGR